MVGNFETSEFVFTTETAVILLGIGSLVAVICTAIVVYIRRIKEKIKGFVLEREKIEKYFQED